MDHPSIRSSQVKGSQCRLRRIDQTLQETTQRFVESLSKDIRISQHADPEYASKKIESDIWYWLTPVDNGRPGYLVFLPNQPAIWMDEQFKHAFSIPICVSPQIYQQKTVCIASLDKQDSLLRLEDAWFVSGEFLRTKPFSKRWEKLASFFHTSYKHDSFLQQGLRIELASFHPLSNLETLLSSSLNPPSCLFAQGETSPRRLRIPLYSPIHSNNPSKQQPRHLSSKVYPPSSSKTPPKQSPTSTPPLISKNASTLQTNEIPTLPMAPMIPMVGSQVASLVPHDTFPDTYNILIDSVKKGYAAVQDLDMSLMLRKRVEQKLPLTVNVEWNSEFNMYEICSLLTEDK